MGTHPLERKALSEPTGAPVSASSREDEPRRLPTLAELLGGMRQHPLQVGYDPNRYPHPPEWARPPARPPVIQNGYSYASEKEAAAARQVIDPTAEWTGRPPGLSPPGGN